MSMRQRKPLQNKSRKPIGVFDSGVGGLTVVKELVKALPGEEIIYFGDTARVPYGSKSRRTIIRFSLENGLFLDKHNVKLIVVACNTSSSVSLPALRRKFKIPVIGVIAPGASDAVGISRNKRIGVIGTSATIASNAYKRQILKLSPRAKVFSLSCPLFVPLAEEGWLDTKITHDVIGKYIKPLKARNIDTLVLGCTHYPLLKKAIADIAGRRISLVDSAKSTAASAGLLLKNQGALCATRRKASVKFFVSDEPARFKEIGERFLGRKLVNVRKIKNGL